MFRRILKKDLKRKKTMNVVLLLFVILCSMFAAASVNNIIAVTGGIDHYFELAEMPDVIVEIEAYSENDAVEKILALPSVKDYKISRALLIMSSKNFSLNGERMNNFISPVVVFPENEILNSFDGENRKIESVEEGSFYASAVFTQDIDLEEGDEVVLNVGGLSLPLRYAGQLKNAQAGTTESSDPFLLVNSRDYDRIDSEEDAHVMFLRDIGINNADLDELEAAAEEDDSITVRTRDSYREGFLYDMIAAYVMMAISIMLLVTVFVVLKFSIGFTIAEDFREIGVMKAVGIDNWSIRRLYMIKYMAIAVVGALIGFACSLPLTDLMLETVSKNMVLGGEHSSLMGLLSSVGVVAVILLFCYLSTRRVKKLSPIDAVRSGQTGERFKKRSLLKLGRSRLPSTGFLAFNDVLSAPKQFCIITLVFALNLLMITTMSVFSLTLRDESIHQFFDIPESDACILEPMMLRDMLIDQSSAEKTIEDTEKLLRENDMPGSCTVTLFVRGKAFKDGTQAKLRFGVLKGHTEDKLTVDEGSLPQKDDEVMLTVSAMEELGAEIGDRITAQIGDREYEFIITGRHSTFQSKVVFLNKDFDMGSVPTNGTVGVQIKFDGDPDREQVEKNIERLRELMDTDKVVTISEMIKSFTGISDMLDAIKQMMIIITVIVTAMIAVLMERSFISKEKSEIALMKAVGVSSGSIIAQHTLRFVIVSLLACVISGAVLMPLSDLLMNRICLLIGDVSGIKCVFDPIEVFVIAPLLIVGVTAASSFLTALYTRTIKASDTASIE